MSNPYYNRWRQQVNSIQCVSWLCTTHPILCAHHVKIASANMPVVAFWKHFSVKDALDFLLSAWTRINPATINHTWQLLVSHLCSRQATIQPPLCNRQASIQPLADAEAVTLSAAQAMPNFQHLTITEIQETHTARVEMDPNTILQQCGQCSVLLKQQRGAIISDDYDNNDREPRWSHRLPTLHLAGMTTRQTWLTLPWKPCYVSPSGQLSTAVFWVPIFLLF